MPCQSRKDAFFWRRAPGAGDAPPLAAAFTFDSAGRATDNPRYTQLRGLRLAWRRGLHLALLAAARMVGVGEFEQFDGRAIFDYERDADAVGWAVGRNQDFAASKLGGEISHFKRDVRNLPDEIRDRRVGFERIHSTPNSLFSWLTTKTLRCFKWVSPGFASVVGIPM